MNTEQLTMQMIMHGGTARSRAMEAIALAKEGKLAEAQDSLAQADEALTAAHLAQSELIEAESEGAVIPPTLLIMHAQDHLMNAMTIKDMAGEFVSLYAELKAPRKPQ